MAVSHANCTHPRTPAGRRACRAATDAGGSTFLSGRQVQREYAERAPKTPVKPVRIQPRRSGARVAARGSACVQAALHVDTHGGRCACGWKAAA